MSTRPHYLMHKNLVVGNLLKWFQPLPRHLRVMGYTSELRALDQRSRRCRSYWQRHLENSRAVILQATEECVYTNKVLIVGSGLLLDLPLDELAGRFGTVVLADIVHCRRARRAASRYDNVQLVQVDVTGVVQRVYAQARAGCAVDLPRHRPTLFLNDEFDLVVSLNVLSQLPVIPNGYAARHVKNLPEGTIDGFSRCLVENHLDWLARFPAVVCLIADLERWYCKGSTIVKREVSLWGVDLPDGAKEWQWDIAPWPEMDTRFDIRHRVAAYASFPKQAWLERKLC